MQTPRTPDRTPSPSPCPSAPLPGPLRRALSAPESPAPRPAPLVSDSPAEPSLVELAHRQQRQCPVVSPEAEALAASPRLVAQLQATFLGLGANGHGLQPRPSAPAAVVRSHLRLQQALEAPASPPPAPPAASPAGSPQQPHALGSPIRDVATRPLSPSLVTEALRMFAEADPEVLAPAHAQPMDTAVSEGRTSPWSPADARMFSPRSSERARARRSAAWGRSPADVSMADSRSPARSDVSMASPSSSAGRGRAPDVTMRDAERDAGSDVDMFSPASSARRD